MDWLAAKWSDKRRDFRNNATVGERKLDARFRLGDSRHTEDFIGTDFFRPASAVPATSKETVFRQPAHK